MRAGDVVESKPHGQVDEAFKMRIARVNPRHLMLTAALGAVAFVAALLLWSKRTDQPVPAVSTLQANRSWEHAAAPSVSPDALPTAATDGSTQPVHAGAASDAAQLPPAVAEPVTLQDGTVIWELKRERSTSSPAREH